MKIKNITTGSYSFTFDGSLLDWESTPENLNFKDGDCIDAYRRQTGGKPVILMYPTKETKIQSVTVSLEKTKWYLHNIYPKRHTNQELSDYKEVVTWNDLTVQKNGEISFANSTEKYRYLFWESKSVSKFDFSQMKVCYYVQKNEIESFLYSYLKNERLREFDIHDFITFWLNDLSEKDAALIQFMEKEEYESKVQVKILPKPRKFIKIFMLFVGIDSKKEEVSKKLRIINWNGNLSFEKKEELNKDEFVAYEWGGMNLINSSYVQ